MARILILNLGSTSSKIAIYENTTCIQNKTIRHNIQLTSLKLIDQKEPRMKLIKYFIEQTVGMDFSQFHAIACRGGIVKPISGGVYRIDKAMYNELKVFKYGIHASNLSGIIGYELGSFLNIPVFTVDPVVVDELMPIAKVTGIKGIERRSVFHALNQKAVARHYAMSVEKPTLT